MRQRGQFTAHRGRSGRSARPAAARYRLTPALRLKLQREAAALGLTCEEYVRLVLALSRSMRSGLTASQDRFDAKMLVKLVDNPLFSAMMQYITRSAVNRVDHGETENAPTPEVESTPQTPTPQNGTNTQSPQTPQVVAPRHQDPYEQFRPTYPLPQQPSYDIPPWGYL